MAEMMTETNEMEDAFYSSPEGAEEVSEETETTEETPESIDEEEAANPTALIPTSALGKSAKIGDTITLKVVKIYDDEAEVRISSGKTKTTTEETMSADDELDAMEKA